MPLFWPKPTILPRRLGPALQSRNPGCWVRDSSGSPKVAAGPKPQVAVKVSMPCSLFAHLTCPLFKSNARAVSKKSSSRDAVRRKELLSGKLPRLRELCSCFQCRRIAYRALDQSRWLPNRTAAVSTRLSAIVRHVEGLQSIAPFFSSSATTLPRKLQHGYAGSSARVSSLDETPT